MAFLRRNRNRTVHDHEFADASLMFLRNYVTFYLENTLTG